MQILRPVQVLALRTRLQPQRRLRKPGAEIPAGSLPAKLLLDSRVKLFKRNSRFRVRLVLRQARVDQLFLLVSERVGLIEPFVGIEFRELETNLFVLFLCELG